MKSALIALSLLVAGSTVCFAQCDKKLRLTSSKTDHLDASNNLERTEDEQTVIEINKLNITVVIEDGKQTLTGLIKSNTCNWTTPFKQGKTIINTSLSNENADGEKDYTLTIEGKDGKVMLLVESIQKPDKKLRLPIDKFEEEK